MNADMSSTLTASCPDTLKSTTSLSSCIMSSCTAYPTLNPKEVCLSSFCHYKNLQSKLTFPCLSCLLFPCLRRLPSLPEDLPGNATSLYIRNIVWKLLFQFSVVCGKNNTIKHMDFKGFIVCYGSNVQGDCNTSICITIEPGLLLKGDILVRV